MIDTENNRFENWMIIFELPRNRLYVNHTYDLLIYYLGDIYGNWSGPQD